MRKKLSDKQLETLRNNGKESNRITKESITGALFILLENKKLSEITISEIINKSGVSRSAFYKNYKTKEAILYEFMDESIMQVFGNMDQNIEKNWYMILEYVRQNKKIFSTLLETGVGDEFLRRMNTYSDFNDENNYIDTIWRGMIYNIILSYINTGFKDTKKSTKAIASSLQTVAKQLSENTLEKEYIEKSKKLYII